jgi:hypothetical protein
MTWAAVEAEIAVEMRGYIDADREEIERLVWVEHLLRDQRNEHHRERNAKPRAVAKRVEWMRKKRASMTPQERKVAAAKAREYRRKYNAKKEAGHGVAP